MKWQSLGRSRQRACACLCTCLHVVTCVVAHTSGCDLSSLTDRNDARPVECCPPRHARLHHDVSFGVQQRPHLVYARMCDELRPHANACMQKNTIADETTNDANSTRIQVAFAHDATGTYHPHHVAATSHGTVQRRVPVLSLTIDACFEVQQQRHHFVPPVFARQVHRGVPVKNQPTNQSNSSTVTTQTVLRGTTTSNCASSRIRRPGAPIGTNERLRARWIRDEYKGKAVGGNRPSGELNEWKQRMRGPIAADGHARTRTD